MICFAAVILVFVEELSGVVQKAYQVGSYRRNYLILAFAEEVSVSVICVAVCFGVCRGGVSESDLWCRRYFGVCRGGINLSNLCRRSNSGICRGGVSVIDLWHRSYSNVCRGGGSLGDLCRRNYSGVCRGGVSVSDPWFGGAAIIMVFAEEVSV